MTSRKAQSHHIDDDEGGEAKTWRPAFTLAEFRLNQLMTQRNEVGPNSYRPDVSKSSTCRNPPSVSFTRSARFAQGARVYISRHHNADMLGQHSPGPKYNPQLPKGEPHVVVWGEPPKKQNLGVFEAPNTVTRAGPATYNPNINAVKRVAPAHAFAPADFSQFNSRRQSPASKTQTQTVQPAQGEESSTTPKELPPLSNIQVLSRVKASPSFSFSLAGKNAKQPRGVPMGSAGRDMLLMTSAFVDEDKLLRERPKVPPPPKRNKYDPLEPDPRLKLLPRSAPAISMPDNVRLIPHPRDWTSPHRHGGGRGKGRRI